MIADKKCTSTLNPYPNGIVSQAKSQLLPKTHIARLVSAAVLVGYYKIKGYNCIVEFLHIRRGSFKVQMTMNSKKSAVTICCNILDYRKKSIHILEVGNII
jgi:hypothetical protein